MLDHLLFSRNVSLNLNLQHYTTVLLDMCIECVTQTAETSKSLEHILTDKEVQKTAIALSHQHVIVYFMGLVEVGVLPICGRGL